MWKCLLFIPSKRASLCWTRKGALFYIFSCIHNFSTFFFLSLARLLDITPWSRLFFSQARTITVKKTPECFSRRFLFEIHIKSVFNFARSLKFSKIPRLNTKCLSLFSLNSEVPVVEETKKVVESDDAPVVASGEETESTTPAAAVEEPEAAAAPVEETDETKAETTSEEVAENGNGEKVDGAEEAGKFWTLIDQFPTAWRYSCIPSLFLAEESLKRRVEEDAEEVSEVPEKKSKVDEVEEVVEPEEATA